MAPSSDEILLCAVGGGVFRVDFSPSVISAQAFLTGRQILSKNRLFESFPLGDLTGHWENDGMRHVEF